MRMYARSVFVLFSALSLGACAPVLAPVDQDGINAGREAAPVVGEWGSYDSLTDAFSVGERHLVLGAGVYVVAGHDIPADVSLTGSGQDSVVTVDALERYGAWYAGNIDIRDLTLDLTKVQFLQAQDIHMVWDGLTVVAAQDGHDRATFSGSQLTIIDSDVQGCHLITGPTTYLHAVSSTFSESEDTALQVGGYTVLDQVLFENNHLAIGINDAWDAYLVAMGTSLVGNEYSVWQTAEEQRVSELFPSDEDFLCDAWGCF